MHATYSPPRLLRKTTVRPRRVSPLEARERVDSIQAAFPREGLFEGKTWRVSPVPFPLSEREIRYLEKLGPRLLKFYKASEVLYQSSARGKRAPWVAQYLDAGKPEELRELNRAPALRGQTPQVIRPDLLLTEDGFAVSELDSVPGGIGLTQWLNETYVNLGEDVIGGPEGMLAGFASLFGGGSAEILVSQEARDYRPEMEFLCRRLTESGHNGFRVADAETVAEPWAEHYYRFFELFDLANLPGARRLLEGVAAGSTRLTSPPKTFFEEKLWLALLWAKPLEKFWIRALGGRYFRDLQEIVPFGWVLDPAPLPPHAVLPRLELHSWEELKDLSQAQRALVLKISGFSELAWGSRGVTIAQDVSHKEWREAVTGAIRAFPEAPHMLQEFKRARIVEHPWFNPDTGKVEQMAGRVRLCPYYFVPDPLGKVAKLAGVLCTIVPADKKIIHGMKDGILVPAAASG